MKTLKIGKLKLKNSLLLAPMLEVSDLPYRIICRRAGCSLAFTEMIHFSAIIHENNKTKKMMEISEEERPVGIQITGNSVEDLKKIVPYLKKYDIVDLNCGCPSDRIAGNDSGAALLDNPKKIGEMIKVLKKEKLIVTAKIRLGFKKNNVVKIAKTIESAGADAIIVHARLANQGYDVKADWTWIEKIKRAVKIPVIGNGDVFSGRDAERMLKIADGVMIGRGAIGDPLIFSRILEYLETGNEPKKDFGEGIKCFLKYIELCEKYDSIDTEKIPSVQTPYFSSRESKRNFRGAQELQTRSGLQSGVLDINKMKYIGCHFIKGVLGAAEMRKKIMDCKNVGEIKRFLEIISSKQD